MLYYMYEVKNNLNGKIYVGVHKTNKLDDGYMGSGNAIRSAIKKYGIDNFTKVILEYFDDSESMYAKEKEVVTEEFLARNDVYNLRTGGFGGFSESSALKGKAALDIKRSDPEVVSNWSAKISASLKTRIADGMITGFLVPGAAKEFSALAHSDEAKAKRAETRKAQQFQQGVNNSQHGTTWIWHEMFGNKKIQKDLLSEYINQGWSKRYIPGYRVKEIQNALVD